MEAGASRAALSLMIGRKYADNAVTQKLVETLAAMLALQQEKAELMSSRSEKHPDVVLVTQTRSPPPVPRPAQRGQRPTHRPRHLHLESLRLQQQMLQKLDRVNACKGGGTPYSTDEASSNSGGRDNQVPRTRQR
ncbi:MAG: hypothetical protein R3C02_15900 [Planctomycetaceae bacterium]